jgi:hypothetical protein
MSYFDKIIIFDNTRTCDSPVSGSQISACPLQLQGTQGANGPPFAGS